ncbi:MAG TPA: pyridoxal kinase PdxY [Alphaproteobacteria bacterium]|jgi:pyridoxine kinase
MAILSIQSFVAYGHVGNSAALLPLQRLGHEVWPIPTVSFSNHPDYGDWTGQVVPAAEVEALVEGVARRGGFARCEAVLSGYLGDLATGRVLLDAVARVKAANPKALYLLDPVLGDNLRGLYVRPGIPEFFRDSAIAAADIVTPNDFELEVLSDLPARDFASARIAAASLLPRGPRLVVVTGLREGKRIGTLAVTSTGAWRVLTPIVEAPAQGAGDVFAATFLGAYLRYARGRGARTAIPSALAHATTAVFRLLKATARAGGDALALVAAQDAFADPGRRYAVESLR